MNKPYVGVGRRFLGSLIDGIPLMALWIFVTARFGQETTVVTSTGEEVSLGSFLSVSGTGLLLLIAFNAFYYIGMELTFGGTLGKLFLGMRVREANGTELSVKGAILRYIFRWIDALPFMYIIGAICVVATPKKQRLGDLVGGTVVVYKEAIYVPAAQPNPAVSWQS